MPALQAVADSGHELLAVVTRPDAPSGRGRRVSRSPVAEWADQHDIPVRTPRRPRDEDFLAWLRATAPDCVPVVAYGALIPPAALALPAYGWLNLHFSLLPAWRGAAPVQHAVLHGDEVTGASVFALEEGLDTGPVYGTLTEPVRRGDTSGDLLDRLAVSGAGLLVAVLDAIEAGTARAEPQPADGVSLAPKITVEDARIRWHEPAFAVDRRIRACSPAPGSWTTIGDERVKVFPLRPEQAELSFGQPLPAIGELLVERRRVLVGTGDRPVLLDEVQPAGKKRMPATAWVRGARLTTGDRFS